MFVLLEGEEAERAAATPAMSEEELIERFKTEFDAEEVEDAKPAPASEPKEATG